ncbi:MAG: HAD hydrolase-like protein, partial [Anaerolineae bacterium]|nr:HAD hydrolase-like protein [Anaerolineae bacterium]
PLRSAPWYVAIGDGRLELSSSEYQTIESAMCKASELLNLHIAADLAWRKPGPGMLREACSRHSGTMGQALFVGDSDADAGAARSAGVRFVFADRFFGSGDVVSPDLDLQGDICGYERTT